MSAPEPPVIRHIDYSEYHPLDHSVWRCGWPGGRRRHLRYRWEYQWRSRLRSATLCRLGCHDPIEWFGHAPDGSVLRAGVSCADCDKDLEGDPGEPV